MVAELGERLPRGSILVSVHHDGRFLIPHGDTVLHAGDKVTAFTRRTDEDALRTTIREGTSKTQPPPVAYALQVGQLNNGPKRTKEGNSQ